MHAIVRLRTTRFYPCLSANYQFFYFSPRHWTTAETLLCLLIFTRTDPRFFFFFFTTNYFPSETRGRVASIFASTSVENKFKNIPFLFSAEKKRCLFENLREMLG